MFSAKMIRPLVDYSDNDEDVEEEEEYVNNSNIADEEIWGTGKRIEKLITVKCVEKHTHHLLLISISPSTSVKFCSRDTILLLLR